MRVEVKGIQINYELSGKAGAPVVMLSHSLGSSLVMWEPQMRALETYYQVLRYDTRGHGSTDAPTGSYTLQQLGEDAIGLVDALRRDAVHWVGLSLGGMIGQYLALNHSHRLRSLVLCDTAANMPKEGQAMRQERIETARNKGMRALLQPTLERWFTPPFLKQNSREVTLIRNHFLATEVTGYIGCSEAIKGLNYLDRLCEIKIPTLIIVGEDDPGTPVTASKAMHERIPGSKLVVLPSAAHLSNVEQADAFNRTVLDFLREH
ncbi:MAG: 3-oxoadipate enol-lactonase [Proteobacteria bacterium]|nr:3-oxoadipate enol-lactonase [Pseudomonadota bacterium]